MSEAKITGSAPVLLVEDVEITAAYYRDQLGFTFERLWGEPPCFCILEHGRCHLMISRADDPEAITPNHRADPGLWDVYFWVDDVEAFYASAKARGAMIEELPTDQPHGCRECVIQDPNGYRIAFGEVLEEEV